MTQPAPIKERITLPSGLASRAWIRWFLELANDTIKGVFKTESGRIQNITTITATTTLDSTHHIVFCNTDSGAFTVNMPAIAQGTEYRIANVGTSGNKVTWTPSGTEKIFGVNASESIYDQEDFQVNGDTVRGWE